MTLGLAIIGFLVIIGIIAYGAYSLTNDIEVKSTKKDEENDD